MEFTCANCGETFENAWTKEEAIEELQQNFGDYDPKDCEVFCDDCYDHLMNVISLIDNL